MLVKVLDRIALGLDTPLDALNKFGEVEIYDSSNEEELIARVANAEVILINKLKITRAVMDAAPSLKLICVFATGFDNIDIKYARERGIAVCNVPGYSTDSVVLFTISNVLALYSHLREYNDFVTSGKYSESSSANKLTPVYHELRGKTWGIVGCGNIGSAVAKVAEAFGARVITYQRRKHEIYETVSIDTLCRESDVITIHCPLNEESRGLINAEKIQLMKRDVIIVNEARGAVVNESDIADAIKQGLIGGYGSDVYSEEPFRKNHPFYEIKCMQNVLLTPHAAWGAYEARCRCIGIVCENIEAFKNNELLNRVDK